MYLLAELPSELTCCLKYYFRQRLSIYGVGRLKEINYTKRFSDSEILEGVFSFVIPVHCKEAYEICNEMLRATTGTT